MASWSPPRFVSVPPPQLFHALIFVYGKARRWGEVRRYLDRMVTAAGVQPRTILWLAHARCRSRPDPTAIDPIDVQRTRSVCVVWDPALILVPPPSLSKHRSCPNPTPLFFPLFQMVIFPGISFPFVYFQEKRNREVQKLRH